MRTAVGLVLGALILAAAIFLFQFTKENFGGGENTADFPGGTYWYCQENEHHFNLSIEEVGEWYQEHPGRSPECPVCGSEETVRVREGTTEVIGGGQRYGN